MRKEAMHITRRTRFLRAWHPGRKAVVLFGTIGAVAALGAGAGGYALASNSAPAARGVNGPYSVCTNSNAEAFVYNNNPNCIGHSYKLNGFFVAGPQGPAGPAGPAGPQGPAGPAGKSANTGLFTEVDNGTQFTVSTSLNVADTSASGATYSDAGVVQDLGTLSSVTTSSLAYTGGAGLAENLWIGNGPEASTAGTHSLAGGADFCYGLGQSGGTFYMTDAACGSYDGQTLTLAQIQSDFPGALEAYAWVGITSSGSAVAPTPITKIDGQQIGETAAILASGGVLTPLVSTQSS